MRIQINEDNQAGIKLLWAMSNPAQSVPSVVNMLIAEAIQTRKEEVKAARKLRSAKPDPVPARHALK